MTSTTTATDSPLSQLPDGASADYAGVVRSFIHLLIAALLLTSSTSFARAFAENSHLASSILAPKTASGVSRVESGANVVGERLQLPETHQEIGESFDATASVLVVLVHNTCQIHVDSNFLVWLDQGNPVAERFARQYAGRLAVSRTAAREFIRGGQRGIAGRPGRLAGYRRQYGIEIAEDAAGVFAKNDSIVIATARARGAALISGDFNVARDAIAAGVNTRFLNLHPNSAISKRYGRAIRSPNIGPDNILGLNPF